MNNQIPTLQPPEPRPPDPIQSYPTSSPKAIAVLKLTFILLMNAFIFLQPVCISPNAICGCCVFKQEAFKLCATGKLKQVSPVSPQAAKKTHARPLVQAGQTWRGHVATNRASWQAAGLGGRTVWSLHVRRLGTCRLTATLGPQAERPGRPHPDSCVLIVTKSTRHKICRLLSAQFRSIRPIHTVEQRAFHLPN